MYKLIESAAKSLKEKIIIENLKIDENDKSKIFVDELEFSNYEVSFKEKIIENFYYLIHERNVDSEINFNALENEYGYYGTVEKDFSTITNPKKAGGDRFWRLINYFWSAYFSIVVPILENSDKYVNIINAKDDINYAYCLNNLEKIVEDIYSDDFLEKYNVEAENDYYSYFKEHFMPKYAATMNYTPFIKRMGVKRDSIAFLAGELCVFENPIELDVFNIIEKKLNDNDFIFPFIMTQAPIKPIISYYQLKEYFNFLKYIDEVKAVIIIGFSLGTSDDHINSLLHHAVVNGKKIIYCEYSKNEFEILDKKNEICKKIHISEELSDKVHIIRNDGNIKKLVENLDNELNR